MDLDPAFARAALDWLLECGADEALAEAPVDRTALPATLTPARAQAGAQDRAQDRARARAPVPEAPLVPRGSPAEEAARLAQGAPDLATLAAAMQGFECDLKPGARSFVFADGTPGAPLMVVGEAPGREEDISGKPFVGEAGRLLDRMLAAIGRDRADPDPARSVYITNLLPWRPPGNRRPETPEVDRWRPFLARHAELAAPRLLLLMGNSPCLALLGQGAITRIRGAWTQAAGRPALPTFHPAYLLRNPAAKREAWADLLLAKARLDGSLLPNEDP